MTAGWLMALWMTALPPVDEDRLPELIREQQGQVVVINFWATWCGPCREELPYFVDLHRKQQDRGLVVIAISMDEPEDMEKAQRFLQEQGARFPSYIRGFRDFEDFVNAIDPSWSGALPATFIFDRSGSLQFKRVGEITRDELQKAVEPLLGS